MARGRKSGGKRAKKVTVSLLARSHAGKTPAAYQIMDRLIEEHHDHLAGAKIAIAWRMEKKADVDGNMWYGAVKKGSDLDREMHSFDFIILVNYDIWNSGSFTEKQMVALMDDLLCRCEVAKDSNGETKVDEKNRTVYRVRKPDLNVFSESIRRNGLWMDSIKTAARAMCHAEKHPLFKKLEEAEAAASQSPTSKEPAKGETPADKSGAADDKESPATLPIFGGKDATTAIKAPAKQTTMKSAARKTAARKSAASAKKKPR